MTGENGEDYRKNNIGRFCEKELTVDEIRDRCHLTGKYRGPSDQSCKINFTQKQSNFKPFVFHNISNYDCHLFFKSWLIKTRIK